MELTTERNATDGRLETRNTTVNSTPRSRSSLLTVAKVIEETDDARSIVFEVPNELRDRFSYKPGQFLTLRIPSTRTGSVARCYSLASSPHTDVEPKVTIKRTVDGYGSNWLCDNVRVGDTIEVLAADRPLHPQASRPRFPVVGGRQWHYTGEFDPEIGTCRGRRPRDADLRQPR